jgi:hypothetical protein
MQRSSLASDFAIVKEWERIYGKPARAFRYDPTELTVCCRKCGKLKKKMSRHHKGNDFFFAQMRPQDFAARYIEFRKEDTAKLCDGCHKLAHRLYKPLMEKVWWELYDGGQKIITKEWCEKWMTIFREVFDKWVVKAPRKRKKRRRRKSGLPTKREV